VKIRLKIFENAMNFAMLETFKTGKSFYLGGPDDQFF
jgi:hypothetical protein